MTIEEVLRALLDGKKITSQGWENNYFYLEDGVLLDEDGVEMSFNILDILDNNFHVWEPPKEKKRYWRWKINNDHWRKHQCYMDDDGKCSDGSVYFTTKIWDVMEKIKIEDDYIEV